ncbi:hypothetical protein [Pantoea sp.]|uniref:hypothetical protein n=1 Tax=Pantoea sp. TaxID=69393 RepID=UPI0028977940|nr:hypothetical protein [Pantoea sp.]
MSIRIDLFAGKTLNDCSISPSGYVIDVIPDNEIPNWFKQHYSLRQAIGYYFGKTPENAYLKSPTPWGDLYTTYRWEQVKRILMPVKAEILELRDVPVSLKTQTFTNNSSVEATFNVAISDTVSNATAFKWSTGGTFTIGQKFTYGVDFLAKATGETSVEYSQNWGIDETKTETVTFGSSSGLVVRLLPKQSVKAPLKASHGIIKSRVWYDGYLTGSVAANYNPPYKNHHFWSFPVQSILNAGRINNRIQSTQDIELRYYSNAEIVITDNKDKILKTVQLSDIPGDLNKKGYILDINK